MFMEHFGNGQPPAYKPSWASIRTNEYQYIEYYTQSTSGSGEVIDFREYYDLEKDPHQLVNLLADGEPRNDPPIVPALQATIAEARICAGSSCP